MPMAESFAGGIEEDRVRRRNLADKVQAYRSLMPYELQKALTIEAAKLAYDPKLRASGDLSKMLSQPQTTNIPWNPELGHEGEVPVGGAPMTLPIDRRRAAGLAVQAGMPPKNLQGLLRIAEGPGAAATPTAQEGFGLARLFDEEGNVTGYRETRTPQERVPLGVDSRDYFKLEADAEKQFPGDVLAQRKWLRERLNELARGTAGAKAAGTVEGGYTGPAREAKAGTSEATAAAGERGKAQAQLETILSPITNEPTPRTTAVKQAQAAGEAIPASERKALSELAVLNELTASVERDSKNFTEPFFGPVTGRLGTIRERYTGDMGEAEVSVRRNLGDIKDTLLRARSGAQINEQEYNRLSRLVPDINDPANVAKYKMNSFKAALRIITEERKRLQGTTGGALQRSTQPTTPTDPLEGRTATGPNGQKIIRRNGKWEPAPR